MGDPLYADGVGLAVVLITLLKVLVAFAFTLVATMFMVWFERKIIADMQHRIGPNRAGPWGILQTLADGTKLFFKEDLLPDRAAQIPRDRLAILFDVGQKPETRGAHNQREDETDNQQRPAHHAVSEQRTDPQPSEN